jgi:uncharacterized protein
MWAMRLAQECPQANLDALSAAAIFHDVGYAFLKEGEAHAQSSAAICERYLKEHGYDEDFLRQVFYLFRQHSNKELLQAGDTPIELVLLMEADLLDETGALSIVWDCMLEGAKTEQSFKNAYRHIMDYSYRIIGKSPMATPMGKALWERKQRMVWEFTAQLAYDLGIEQSQK